MSDTATLVSESDTAPTLSSPPNATPIVIAFGTTGAGKSSVINMLPDNPAYTAEKAVAKASVVGVTAEVKHFHKMIDGRPFTILDTMGMGEMKTGTVPTHLAIERLYDHLVASSTPAIHLVLIVMKAGRMTSLDECNYLLARYLFGDKVPIALALTHMENMENRDTWWNGQDNRGRLGLLDAVGVVSFIGLRNILEPFYNESKESLCRFMSTQLRPGVGFKLHGKPRVSRLIAALAKLVARHNEAARFYAAMLDLLKDYEIEDRHAKALAAKMQVVAPLPVVVFVGTQGSGKTTIIDMLPPNPSSSTPTPGDVQESIRIVKGQRIRVLETLSIPPPSQPDSPSLSRAVRALYDAFMAHPLGIRLVVCVAKVEGEDLASIDITHYRAIRRLCGNHVPICLITVHAKNRSSSNSLISRNKELAFQKHIPLAMILPGATQQQLDTSKFIEGAVASLVKSNGDSPVQPALDLPSLITSLPGYEALKLSKDSADIEELEPVNPLHSFQSERRRVLLYGSSEAGTTSVAKMFNDAPRAKEFELIDDDIPLHHLRSGLSLFVLVLSASRITSGDKHRYNILKSFSEGRIPVCIVATHMDTLDDPTTWWEKSKESFIKAAIDLASPPTCVTAIRGPIINQETGERAYDAQYEASVIKLERLFLDNALSTPYSRPKPNPTRFEKMMAKFVVRAGGKAPGFSKYIYESYRSSGRSEKDAKEIANYWALWEYLPD